MCGRITRGREEFDNGEHFQLRIVDVTGWDPSWNAAPGQQMPIVLEDKTGARQLVRMTWGLTRPNAPASDPKPINARAETVATTPRFSQLLPFRRCIVPATGWYEWRRERGRRQPYFARPVDHPIFGFAGLYNVQRHPNGALHCTYCIITTQPTTDLTPLHDRMPVVLPPDQEARWLSKTVTTLDDILPLLRPYDRSPIDWWPVSTRVNDPRQNTPQLILPHLDGAELRGTLPATYQGAPAPRQSSLFDESV